MGKARGAASAASEGLAAAAKVEQAAGKAEEAAKLVAAAGEQATKAMIYKVGSFVLGGPAEKMIGSISGKLLNSLHSTFNTLRGTTSATHKLETVKNSIKDFENAIADETHMP